MFKELAQYVAPKRKAVEVQGDVGFSYIDAILAASRKSEDTSINTDPK
jgi:hypothetical protein